MQPGFNATNQMQVNAVYIGHRNQNYNTPYVNQQQPQIYDQQNDNGQHYHPNTSYYQAGFGQQQPQCYYNPHQYPVNQNHIQNTNGLF